MPGNPDHFVAVAGQVCSNVHSCEVNLHDQWLRKLLGLMLQLFVPFKAGYVCLAQLFDRNGTTLQLIPKLKFLIYTHLGSYARQKNPANWALIELCYERTMP